MRLFELTQDPLVAKLKNAVGIMMARSKTVGEPYEVSYEQLARLIDYPGHLSKQDVESAMNTDTSLASEISNFGDDFLEVDANSANALDIPSDMPPDDMPTDMPPDGMASDMPPDMGAMPGATPAPAVAADANQEQPQQVQRVNTVQQMADRAAKRRGL